MTDTPRAILFDLDGVLIDSYPVWFQLLNHTARELGYPAITAAAYEASWGQSTLDDRDTFFPNHELSAVEAFYEAHYRKHLEHLKIPEGVPRIFARLQERGLTSAVCTNSQASIASEAVRRAGATPDFIVGGDDVPKGKPAPDMLLRACALLDVNPGEVWMVGDSRYDREAAAAANVYFVGMRITGDERVEHLTELLELLRF
jgi:AHBA synthesis associated protein